MEAFLTDQIIAAIILSLKLAGATSLILLIIATPVAWWLSQTKRKIKVIVEALVTLPLILPPTVLGFYLLLAFNPNQFLARLFESLALPQLVFSFYGLVFSSIIYSMPFVIQPLKNAFSSLGKQPLEVAATLGASASDRFFSVILPLCFPAYLSGAVLAFAHTLGEFGIVLMIGGNIPFETQVLSIVIYDQVESLQYQAAHILSGGLLLFSFFTLILVYALNRKFNLINF